MTEVVENRARSPRFKGFFDADGLGAQEMLVAAEGDNPFCGDTIEVRALLATDASGSTAVGRIAFDGFACSLCTAAADALLERVQGATVDEALAVSYDDLIALLGNPAVGRTRSGCVRLPLTVLQRALSKAGAGA